MGVREYEVERATLPAAFASFVCSRREIGDGKVSWIKGNIYFVVLIFFITQARTKVCVP